MRERFLIIQNLLTHKLNYRIVFTILAVSVFSIGASWFGAYAATAPSGSDQSNTAVVNEQTQVTLSGLKSSDPDKDQLSYFWEQVDGEPVTISSTTDPTITFTTPVVSPGETKYLKFALTVNDGHGGQSITSFTLQVIHVNHPPVVTTDHQITIPELSTVNLSGSASDPDNDPLKLMWTQTSGDQVTLSSPDKLTAMFTAPAVGSAGSKDLVFTLTADDGHGGQASDTETVHVVSAASFHLPTLTCGAIIRGHEGGQVRLSVIVDNPDNVPLTYQWAQIAGMPVLLSSGSDPTPVIRLPTGSGGQVVDFQVTVKEDNTIIGQCEQYVYAAPPEPLMPPQADAGPDRTVNQEDVVTLDGSKSTGGYLQYSWKQTGGIPVTLLYPNTGNPVFTAPDVPIGDKQILEFTLLVSNGYGKDAATVHITVVHPNKNPNAIITIQ